MERRTLLDGTTDRGAAAQDFDSIVFQPFVPGLADRLLGMYRGFEPKGAYHGLPPFDAEVARDWLTSLLTNPNNTNLVLSHGTRVIAHAGLVHYPHVPDDQEIIIFVHQDFQHRGLGRQLFLATMHWACRKLHLRRVWLSVNWHNLPARRMYGSVGFEPLPPDDPFDPEIDMERRLSCETCRGPDCPVYSSELARILRPANGDPPEASTNRVNADTVTADLPFLLEEQDR